MIITLTEVLSALLPDTKVEKQNYLRY